MMKILPTPKQTGKTFTYQVTTNHSILVFIVIASHQERNRQVTSKGTGFGRISYWNTDISNPLPFTTGATHKGHWVIDSGISNLCLSPQAQGALLGYLLKHYGSP